MSTATIGALVAFVGSYDDGGEGGIRAFAVSPDGLALTQIASTSEPADAGYLVFDDSHSVLYSVNERKSDGRTSVHPPAGVHAHAVDPNTAALSVLSTHTVPGSFPSYLSLDTATGLVFSTSHGALGEHAQVVRRAPDGTWTVDFVYDDSTVVAWTTSNDGAIAAIGDVQVLTGHGVDPNSSPQAGGHAQAGPHAHCVVVEPSRQYVVVADKGTDQIIVYRIGLPLVEVSRLQLDAETGPRHLVFAADGTTAYATLEFSSELASFTFDPSTGRLGLIGRVPTTAPGHSGLNEPADLRLHPNGDFVYVNNRGEDSLAWFRISDAGAMTRIGHVALAKSLHPGVAARSFTFDPTGSFILLADRPANLVRTFAVDGRTGTATQVATTSVPSPAFIEMSTLPLASAATQKEQA